MPNLLIWCWYPSHVSRELWYMTNNYLTCFSNMSFEDFATTYMASGSHCTQPSELLLAGAKIYLDSLKALVGGKDEDFCERLRNMMPTSADSQRQARQKLLDALRNGLGSDK